MPLDQADFYRTEGLKAMVSQCYIDWDRISPAERRKRAENASTLYKNANTEEGKELVHLIIQKHQRLWREVLRSWGVWAD